MHEAIEITSCRVRSYDSQLTPSTMVTSASLDGALMAVSVDTTDGFYPGKPTPLFQTGLAVDGQVEQYAVASDGIRFLVPTPVGPSVASLVLVQNWFEELKRLVPTE